MDIDRYAQRIGYEGTLTPSLATLRDLHRAHLFTVPFENLDIHRSRAIVLDPAPLFDKIVTQRRGGFCYELNGLFAELLRRIGFGVVQVAAEVALDDGAFGPPFDHMALLVDADGAWHLADVGFGDSFTEPLPLASRDMQVQTHGVFELQSSDDGKFLLLARNTAKSGPMRASFRFASANHLLAEFDAMCFFHQTSPESHFTRKIICSLATPEGRITLSGDQLIRTAGESRTVTPCSSAAEKALALQRHFGIVL